VLDEFIAPCFSVSEYNKTYAHVLQPVEGPANWPISDMPSPEPPGFVKMPGRPKTERRREPGEAPKGTKLSRVGTKITCRLCGKSTHNARRCPKNPEAGKKKNAHIKRDAKKTKKDGQPSTSANRQSTSRGKKRKLSEVCEALSVLWHFCFYKNLHLSICRTWLKALLKFLSMLPHKVPGAARQVPLPSQQAKEGHL